MNRPTAFLSQWGVSGVTAVQAMALLPPVVMALVQGGTPKLLLLTTAVIVVLIWELLFTLLRTGWVSLHGLTVALIVTVFAPADLPLWQLAVALSLGLVLGELIFGGRGFGFLAPATVTLALLMVSFPQSGLATPSPDIALATVPGAFLLLGLGLISWRVIVGVIFGLLALQAMSVEPVALAAALTFGLVFLICDPIAAASTNPGRWLYGVLTGVLIALFSGAGSMVFVESLIFAALLSSLFAPLIDHLVILVDSARRRRRLG